MTDRMAAWKAGEWIPAVPEMRSFNGLVQSCKAEGREYGLFREWAGPYTWTIRTRPLGPGDVPADSWSVPVYAARSKRDALKSFDARDALLPGIAR
ncbi:MAG: hypothetical protein ACOYB2_10690 [Limnohabitans sp.]